MDAYRCNVVIVGGGIAGLWAANRLVRGGCSVAVLESNALGGGQTLASQGILHGGVKYGIDGANRDIALRLKELPPRWLACLEDRGEVALGNVHVLARQQHLWSRDRLLGGFASAMARRAMQGDVEEVPRHCWPEVFQSNPPSGSLYAVKELVLDILSVVTALAKPLEGNLIAGTIERFIRRGAGLDWLEVSVGDGSLIKLQGDAFVFAAGAGNESACQALGFGETATQRRPLRMVLARGLGFPLYGHCVTASPKPRATITSHPQGGAWVWYLGGEIAEKGALLEPRETLERTKKELGRMLPALPWDAVEWACHYVDRAEPRDPAAQLPPEPHVLARGNALIAWPSKLVYAPLLADKLLAAPILSSLHPSKSKSSDFSALPQAPVGRLPWDLPMTWSRL